jgi:hypothetical protein
MYEVTGLVTLCSYFLDKGAPPIRSEMEVATDIEEGATRENLNYNPIFKTVPSHQGPKLSIYRAGFTTSRILFKHI